MANTSLTGSTGTAGSALPAGGGTSTAGLADWASPYITDYLGKAQALSNTPYQTYQGPLTAGASDLQTKAFQGIGNLTIGNRGTYNPVGGSFTDPYIVGGANSSGVGGAGGASGMPYIVGGANSSGVGGASGMPYIGGANYANSGAPDYGNLSMEEVIAQSGSGPLGGMGGGSTGFAQPKSVAEQYMNPYLQQALDPQLRELQRQSDIQRVQDAGRLTQAGAFGGSRQAIMESEGRRNLLGKQSDVLGQGYATAYDKAMQQYNAEQARKIQEAQFGADFGLKGLAAEQGILKDQLNAGGVERGITSEGIAADLEEFNRQREFPYKQIQFQRDMISGLPTGSVTNTPAQLSGIAQLISSVGGIDKLLSATGGGDLKTLLGKLGLNFGSSSEVELP